LMRGLAGLRPDCAEAGLEDAGFKHVSRSQPFANPFERVRSRLWRRRRILPLVIYTSG